MINVYDILLKICEDKRVLDPNFDLIESGLLDSYALIELLSVLEDNNITIQITRIDRDNLRTPASIEKLIKEYKK